MFVLAKKIILMLS